MGAQVQPCGLRVMVVLGFLLLLMMAIACGGDNHLGKYSEQHLVEIPGEAEIPGEVSPILNLKLDVRRKTLTWNYDANVTLHTCCVTTPGDPTTITEPKVRANSTWLCQFPNALFHRGATLAVCGETADGSKFKNIMLFHNAGKEGSGAVNFSCIIYNIQFMNCSWAPGPNAPEDVQYHMYFWFSRDADETECKHYLPDPTGVRTGCHFSELGEPQTFDDYFFLMTGSSTQVAVAFVDFTPFSAMMLEKYNPPENVTIHHEALGPVIRWENPQRRFDLAVSTFCYEVQIQSTGSSQDKHPNCQRGKDTNEYRVPSTESKAEHTVRLRVKHLRGHIWSDWSPTLHFSGEDSAPDHFLVTVVLAVLCTVALAAFVLIMFHKRSSLRQQLCPSIPRVKGDLMAGEVTWVEANLPEISLEPEEFLQVEETQ